MMYKVFNTFVDDVFAFAVRLRAFAASLRPRAARAGD
jgi:hypothetical protein